MFRNVCPKFRNRRPKFRNTCPAIIDDLVYVDLLQSFHIPVFHMANALKFTVHALPENLIRMKNY